MEVADRFETQYLIIDKWMLPRRPKPPGQNVDVTSLPFLRLSLGYVGMADYDLIYSTISFDHSSN